MKNTCYLVLNRNGVTRMTKKPPDLFAGEIAVRLHVTAPAECFRSPFAEATVALDERHVIHPTVDVEVAEP